MNDAQVRLREELLTDGLIESVSLALVDSRVDQQYPTASLSEQQNITLDTIRSMVSEGLFELGDRTGWHDEFEAFDEPLDESMLRIRDAYVNHHDDRLRWVFRYWLNLTEKGKQAATSTQRGRQIAHQVAEAINRSLDERRTKLREELLTDGLFDCVSLSKVDSRVDQECLGASLAEQQGITLETIRSMVSDGLFLLGDRAGGTDRFKAFDEPLAESIRRIKDAYVDGYDDGLGWMFRYWLNLTEKGKQAAMSTERGRQIAREVAEDIARRANNGKGDPAAGR